MKRNTASQTIGAQMVSASDGSAFTVAVTVYVTKDGGTQAVGSVGAGACTHEGNGYHSYAPAQAETDADHIAFTFIGTGAVPATVQAYTSFPQTGDNFARLGAPAGASVSADVAAVKAETASIQSDTNDIQTRLPAALVSGRMDSSVGAMANNVITAAATAADYMAEINAEADTALADVGLTATITGRIDVAVSSRLATAGYTAPDNAGIAANGAAIAVVGAYVDTEVAAVLAAVDTEVAAIKAKTDNLPASPAAVGDIPTALQNADALLNRDMSAVSDTTARSPLNALRFLRNKWSLAGTALTVTKENDTTTAWTATVTAAPGADPISASDPS